MDRDRLAAAFERHILHPSEQIGARRDRPNSMTIQTNWGSYGFRTADWLISLAPWVADAVRVVLSAPMIDHAPAPTYGLIVSTEGEVLLVNEVAAAREMGRRLGEDLDPLAYAELLAEFYSVPDIEGPVVDAIAVSEFTKSGWLVREVDQIIAKFPFLDPTSLRPPAVRRSGREVEVTFQSCHYHQAFRGSVDVLRWSVTGGPGADVRWLREYLVKSVSRP
nr:hypothetical protein [Micromonospora sp. DSM 115978]